MKFLRPSSSERIFDQDESPELDEDIERIERLSTPVTAVGLTGRTYGEPTTFGSQPWHSNKNWWKIPGFGEANDVRSTFGTIGQLVCAATSLRGNKHRLQGGVNQDSFSILEVTSKDDEQFLVVAVCDGMGSAAYSGFAARKAAASCAALLGAGLRGIGRELFEFPERVQVRLVQKIRESVLSFDRLEFDAPQVDREGISEADLQTTLSFAVLSASGPDDFDVLTGTIGDSPVIKVKSGMWEWLQSDTSGGGLHSTASDGLMSTDTLEVHKSTLARGEGLLICTDGVGNYLRFKGGETALGADLRERWTSPPERLDFIRDLSYEIQSADDDRTAVMVWAR